ncbi:alpha/beta hydrolase [Gordonia terrae]|uniref:alpha/beta fold hydrolase n=1 Tax=Gordonia hongkongensis TaxID=1701090 RepID=UPI0022B59A53|nr:alpha/beta hydrolase [Gordonia terrae]
MEHVIQNNGIELCTESFGLASDPPVLLAAGTSCSMDWWPPEFCTRLSSTGCRVIRYDQRDTGRSSFDPPGEPRYSMTGLVADAVAVLDHLGVGSAHWIGFSQGGWVAQLAALDQPLRVRTLTLMSTRPTGHGAPDDDLPDVTPALLEAWQNGPSEPDWDDPEQVVEYLVKGEQSVCGAEFNEAHAREIAARCVRRALQVVSAVTNHPLVAPAPRWRERLASITAPTLVIHGTADPMFPIANANALTREIPGARLQILEGVGHEFPPRVWDRVVGSLREHFRDRPARP